MEAVAVLVPVLNRPSRVAPLLASLYASVADVKVSAYFICSEGDTGQIEAVQHHFAAAPFTVPWPPGRGDYARKINYAFARTLEPYVLIGADDLHFHAGWADNALHHIEKTWACVVGTNDLGNPRVTAGLHATHFVARREYGECGTIDEPGSGKLLHEGYHHNFVDDEFLATALHRETYSHCAVARIEHLHPNWNKAADDDTYRLGQTHFDADRTYHRRRARLWSGRARARVRGRT